MRTVILCAPALALCLGLPPVPALAQQNPPAQQQDAAPKKPEPPATAPSPAAAAPTSAAPAAQPPAAQPPAGETDPLKMAAPPSEGAQKPGVASPTDEKTYVLGAEDVLNLLVWGSTQLSGPHTVRPDGRISVPLVGEIMAAGKTPMELETEIANKLKASKMILNPNVAISVTQVNSKMYYLEGEVNKPGKYSLIVPTTVLEALVNAGGFKDFANQTHIRIIRGKETYNFNYKQVIKSQHTEQNIPLLPGDIIIVR
jgi:polysaccharide biosynthesis/export protein